MAQADRESKVNQRIEEQEVIMGAIREQQEMLETATMLNEDLLVRVYMGRQRALESFADCMAAGMLGHPMAVESQQPTDDTDEPETPHSIEMSPSVPSLAEACGSLADMGGNMDDADADPDSDMDVAMSLVLEAPHSVTLCCTPKQYQGSVVSSSTWPHDMEKQRFQVVPASWQ